MDRGASDVECGGACTGMDRVGHGRGDTRTSGGLAGGWDRGGRVGGGVWRTYFIRDSRTERRDGSRSDENE